jgi:hypothetical protein
MFIDKIANTQLRSSTGRPIDSGSPQDPRGLAASSGHAFHVVDSRQAAAALGAELQALSLSTHPEATLRLGNKEATVLFGAALVALADALA